MSLGAGGGVQREFIMQPEIAGMLHAVVRSAIGRVGRPGADCCYGNNGMPYYGDARLRVVDIMRVMSKVC